MCNMFNQIRSGLDTFGRVYTVDYMFSEHFSYILDLTEHNRTV